MQIDGGNCILRKELPSVLKSILGREPRQEEFDVFFTYVYSFCTPSSVLLLRGVQELLAG